MTPTLSGRSKTGSSRANPVFVAPLRPARPSPHWTGLRDRLIKSLTYRERRALKVAADSFHDSVMRRDKREQGPRYYILKDAREDLMRAEAFWGRWL